MRKGNRRRRQPCGLEIAALVFGVSEETLKGSIVPVRINSEMEMIKIESDDVSPTDSL